MRGVEELRRELADYLCENGLEAVLAWREEKRPRPGKAVAAVSLRGLESKGSGMQDYLGERFDRDRGAWEELYGRQVELTFGLDLYAATAEEVGQGLERLTALLGQGGPGGLQVTELTAGEACWKQERRCYVCSVQGVFKTWAVAVDREEGSFLDFEVKGEQSI